MSVPNVKVEAYLAKSAAWGEELRALRQLLLASELTEDFKWGAPCYTIDGGNVVVIHRFKPHCALGFFKGALLKDAHGMLTQPGENSQSMRQLRVTDAAQIAAQADVIRAYLAEAIAVERAGLKVDKVASRTLEYPEELNEVLAEVEGLQAAFEALTPGRQRAYLLFFCGAKQSATRTSRIEKHVQRILDGKGIADR